MIYVMTYDFCLIMTFVYLMSYDLCLMSHMMSDVKCSHGFGSCLAFGTKTCVFVTRVDALSWVDMPFFTHFYSIWGPHLRLGVIGGPNWLFPRKVFGFRDLDFGHPVLLVKKSLEIGQNSSASSKTTGNWSNSSGQIPAPKHGQLVKFQWPTAGTISGRRFPITSCDREDFLL